MNSAIASRVHAIVHLEVGLLLKTNFPDYTWTIDYDMATDETGKVTVQPDIAGLKADDMVVACEISVSTTHKDTRIKMGIYKEMGVICTAQARSR